MTSSLTSGGSLKALGHLERRPLWRCDWRIAPLWGEEFITFQYFFLNDSLKKRGGTLKEKTCKIMHFFNIQSYSEMICRLETFIQLLF